MHFVADENSKFMNDMIYKISIQFLTSIVVLKRMMKLEMYEASVWMNCGEALAVTWEFYLVFRLFNYQIWFMKRELKYRA